MAAESFSVGGGGDDDAGGERRRMRRRRRREGKGCTTRRKGREWDVRTDMDAGQEREGGRRLRTTTAAAKTTAVGRR